MIATDTESPPRCLLATVEEVSAACSLGKRTIWRLTSAGQFPRPVKIGRAARWRWEDIEAFVRELEP